MPSLFVSGQKVENKNLQDSETFRKVLSLKNRQTDLFMATCFN
jgi:hypothetical protein